LIIDGEVQRTLNDDRVRRIANEFDWAKFEALTVVSCGGGDFVIVEGQHRGAAAKMLDESLKVWCLVLPEGYRGASLEADLGLGISRGRRGHTAFEQWNARFVRGDAHEVEAAKVLQHYHLRLGRTPSSRTIAAVDKVAHIIHDNRRQPETGAELLAKTLAVITSAWAEVDVNSNVHRFDGRLLEALSELIARNPQINLTRLVERLNQKSAQRWLSDELMARTRPAKEAIANGIARAYNYRLKKGEHVA
jgi:hypothetical protein